MENGLTRKRMIYRISREKAEISWPHCGKNINIKVKLYGAIAIDTK